VLLSLLVDLPFGENLTQAPNSGARFLPRRASINVTLFLLWFPRPVHAHDSCTPWLFSCQGIYYRRVQHVEMASRKERPLVFRARYGRLLREDGSGTGRTGLLTVLISLSQHRAIAYAMGEREGTHAKGLPASIHGQPDV
jgi:hypothetical protein